MAKLSQEEKDAIIKRDLPGYKALNTTNSGEGDANEDTRVNMQPDAGTPDFEALRRKYFGESADSGADAEAHAAPDNPGEDDELVQVEPENRSSPLDRGSRAKSVVISGGKVKGSQG